MLSALSYKRLQSFFRRQLGDLIPEIGGKQGCRSGPFSMEAEGRKFYRFRFHTGYLT